MKKKSITPQKMIVFIIMVLVSLTTLFPFYFMAVSAFKRRPEYYINYFGIPTDPTFKNFANLFSELPTAKMFFNSLFVSVAAVIILTLVVTMASFIFTKFPYPGSKKIELGIIAAMMVPPVVLIIPVYLTFSFLRMINSYLSPILFYAAICIPFSIYLCSAGFKSIPDECIEAAMIDGASLSRIYTRIMLPLGKPSIITLVTLNFLWCWNEFLYSMLLLQKPELRTMTVGIALVVGRRTIDMPLMLAGLLMNSLPVLVLFIIGNKYFVKGMTAGAVKG